MPRKADSKKKVFDITRPGETAANASSRPVIVGHKTLLQDPMVTRQIPITAAKKAKPKPDSNDEDNDGETASGEPDLTTKLLPASELTIVPPESSDELAEDEPLKETEAVPEPETEIDKPADNEPVEASTLSEAADSGKTLDESPPEEPKQDEPKSQDETEASEDKSNGSEEVQTDKPSNEQSGDNKQKTSDEDKALAETTKNNTYKKLVDDKTYFVPIGEQKRKRSMRRFLLVIILLLLVAIAAADVLIDNGTIKTSIKAPISIFHRDQ